MSHRSFWPELMRVHIDWMRTSDEFSVVQIKTTKKKFCLRFGVKSNSLPWVLRRKPEGMKSVFQKIGVPPRC